MGSRALRPRASIRARSRPRVSRSRVISSAAGACGSACFPTSRSPRSRPKPAWARARAARKDGPRWCGRDGYCSKWKALIGRPRRRRCVSRRTSCRSRPSWSSGEAKALELDELKQMSADDLRVKEREAREEIFRLRLKLRTNQLDNPANYRRARKELARIMTILRHKSEAPAGER